MWVSLGSYPPTEAIGGNYNNKLAVLSQAWLAYACGTGARVEMRKPGQPAGLCGTVVRTLENEKDDRVVVRVDDIGSAALPAYDVSGKAIAHGDGRRKRRGAVHELAMSEEDARSWEDMSNPWAAMAAQNEMLDAMARQLSLDPSARVARDPKASTAERLTQKVSPFV